MTTVEAYVLHGGPQPRPEFRKSTMISIRHRLSKVFAKVNLVTNADSIVLGNKGSGVTERQEANIRIHLVAWTELLRGTADAALIIEDDAMFLNENIDFLPKAIDPASEDIVFLSPQTKTYIVSKEAYLISRDCVFALLPRFASVTHSFRHHLTNTIRGLGLRMSWATTPITVDGSKIGATNSLVNTKNPLTRHSGFMEVLTYAERGIVRANLDVVTEIMPSIEALDASPDAWALRARLAVVIDRDRDLAYDCLSKAYDLLKNNGGVLHRSETLLELINAFAHVQNRLAKCL